MELPKDHKQEAERLRALESYSIMDTLPEEDYDNLTAIASEICNTDISLVSLIDNKRQWFKSRHGLDVQETPREYALCAHAIHQSGEVFMVEDARKDERFHDNPLVTGKPYVTFYAGVPLTNPDGLPLGTLCVIDKKPKTLNEQQKRSLAALGKQVMNLMELRRSKQVLEAQNALLNTHNDALEKFTKLAANDLKSPISQITGNSLMLMKNHSDLISPRGLGYLEIINRSAQQLEGLVARLLKYDSCLRELGGIRTKTDLHGLTSELEASFADNPGFELTVETETEVLKVARTALKTVLTELVDNTIRHCQQGTVKANLQLKENDGEYLFEFSDNGPGIRSEDQLVIFNPFETGICANKNGTAGSGFGLAIVKRMIEGQGGEVSVASTPGKGTTIGFSIPR